MFLVNDQPVEVVENKIAKIGQKGKDKPVTLRKAFVEIQALKIDNRQLTKAVFKQIPVVDLFKPDVKLSPPKAWSSFVQYELELNGQDSWGWVDCDSEKYLILISRGVLVKAPLSGQNVINKGDSFEFYRDYEADDEDLGGYEYLYKIECNESYGKSWRILGNWDVSFYYDNHEGRGYSADSQHIVRSFLQACLTKIDELTSLSKQLYIAA